MKPKRRSVLLVVGIVLTAVGMAVLVCPDAPGLYRTTILSTCTGLELVPHALNDRGQVVGLIGPNGALRHLFVWDRQNGLEDIGFVAHGDCDINNHGQIAGTGLDPNGLTQAFIMDPNGTVQFLGTLGGGGSQARAINDRGQVVGRSGAHLRFRMHGFLWDRAHGMRDLGEAGGHASEATAISETGLIFGSSEYDEGGRSHRQPCFWNPADPYSSSGMQPPTHDYFAMNGNGGIVGRHTFKRDGPYVVVWNDFGGIERLFPYNPDAGVYVQSTWRINDANQVFYAEEHRSRWERYSAKLFRPRHYYYLWDPDRGRITLNRYLPSQTERFEVRDLNNTGCILGIAHLKGGRIKLPVVLEPIRERWGR